jgi:cytidylate kinase
MPSVKKITIAIDGYAGCGKSTTAKAVAQALDYVYIDSGAMYRAFTLLAFRNGIAPTDTRGLIMLIPQAQISFVSAESGSGFEVALNGQSVEKEIRSLAVSAGVSEVSAVKEVRQALVHLQQEMGKEKGVVMDGRDIGTVVFPDAELKVFMTADLETRVARRKADLLARGLQQTDAEIRENLLHRDHLDTTRAESPLRQAPDARVLDTTGLRFEDQVQQILIWVKECY